MPRPTAKAEHRHRPSTIEANVTEGRYAGSLKQFCSCGLIRYRCSAGNKQWFTLWQRNSADWD